MDLIAKIKAAVPLESVVSEYIELKEQGQQHIGLCPFHEEKTPSFNIKKGSNFYTCFGCDRTGDVIQFLEDHPLTKLTFHEAVKQLAARAKIEIDGKEIAPDPLREEKKLLATINLLADQEYKAQLKPKHIKYLHNRGFTLETIKKFGIGFAEQLPVKLGTYDQETLTAAGLLSQRGNPVFKERLIWPLHARTGRIIGFAGRQWDSKRKTAKYVNSPETVLHKKRYFLFNLNRAAKAIALQQFVLTVEGFTDVMAVDQLGMANVVSLGNSTMTDEQLALIVRFTNSLTICVDGDATKSAVKIIRKASPTLNVRLVVLDKKDDPASWIQTSLEKVGKEETVKNWQNLVNNAENGILWMAKREATRAGNDPDRKYTASLVMAEIVAAIQIDARRENYLRKVATVLDLGIKSFQKMVQEQLPEKAPQDIQEEQQDDKPERFVKIKDTFFEFSVTYDHECEIYTQDYVVRKPSEIERERGKEFVKSISKYNTLVVVPNHGKDYRRVFAFEAYGHQFRQFNWYKPLNFQPKQCTVIENTYPDEIKYTAGFIKHIFGDKEVLGWDYLALLYLKPMQRTQALCLVSSEEGTGKSTFVNYLLKFYGQNATKTTAKRLSGNFNNQLFGKLLITIEETKDEKGHIENDLKDLITGENKVVEPKFADSFMAPSFDKYIFCSNHPETFMKVSTKTTRFAVLEIKRPQYKITDLLEKMVAEIPYAMHYLRERGIVTPCGDRLWFKPELWENEALERLRLASRPITIQVIEEFVELVWIKAKYPRRELRLSSRLLAAYLNRFSDKSGKYTSNGITRLLTENGYKRSKHSTTFSYPMLGMTDHEGWSYEWRNEAGRYFEFFITDFIKDAATLKTVFDREVLEKLFNAEELKGLGIEFEGIDLLTV